MSLVFVGAFQYSEEDGKVICIPILEMRVVHARLPGLDVLAVEDPEHQDFDVEDEKVVCYRVSLASHAF